MNSTLRRAVFLDRDGVLNRVEWKNGVCQSPRSLEDFQLLPGVAEACARLKAAGFLLLVATNQPEIPRGFLQPALLAAMHERLREWLPLDDIRICLHDDGDGCACRKPAPGLLLDAARDWQIDLGRSFMIGDREKDLIAGRRAGCRAILVGAQTVASAPDFSAPDLSRATDWILSLPA